jgi:hypothetical protein
MGIGVASRIAKNSLAASPAKEYKQGVSSLELRRGQNDSTGLKSERTLNTPLSRCESRPSRKQ